MTFLQKKIWCLLLPALLCTYTLTAQNTARKFTDIVQDAENFYRQKGKIPGYKQFRRWQWYYQTRVAYDGSFVNNTQYKQEALVQTNYMRSNLVEANTGSWSLVGPTSVIESGVEGIGRCNRITFHPTNASIFFISTAGGGLWKTTNAGSSYTCLTNGLPNINTCGMAIDYTNTNILYLLTGDGDAGGPAGTMSVARYSTGVLKSYDGGQTWHQTGLSYSETDNIIAYKIVMHPTNPNILIVATNFGLQRTTDGGNTWAQLNTTEFFDIEFKPGSPSVVFAASSLFLFKSTDNGQTFSSAGGTIGSSNFGRTAIAVCPSNVNRVFILAGRAIGDDHFRGFYRYNDADESITLVNDAPNILGRDGSGIDSADQSGYDLAVVAKPDNSNFVITGGIREWRTTNGGTSFTFVSNVSNYHDDIHDLAYNPLNNQLYMCCDGGVYLSLDNGTTWTPLTATLSVSQYYRIATIPSNANLVIGSLQDNGTNKRISNGSSFDKILGADGLDCGFGNTSSIIYAGTQDGNFYQSTNGGSSFPSSPFCTEAIAQAVFNTNSITANFFTPLAVHPNDDDIVYLGYSKLVKATRVLGNAYSLTNLVVPATCFVRVGISNTNRIYAGKNTTGSSSSNTINRSDDGGTTFTQVLNESESSTRPPITDLTINPGNSLEIWYTYGGYVSNRKVFYSSDGGATWTNVTGSLPNVPINCVVYGDNASNAADPVYIGTDIGVFYRDNNLGDWIPFSNGLPVAEVTDLEVNDADNILWAGTYGRGIWQSSLYSSCVASLNLTTANQNFNTSYYHQVSNNIISTAHTYSAGAEVYYKAGVELELKDGFWASALDTTSTFRAFVGPCGGGVPSRPSAAAQIIPRTGYLAGRLPDAPIKPLRR